MKNSLSIYRKQRGLSLIELMIAMVLGLIIMAGVLYIFQGSKQSFRYGDTMARVQENGRLALDTFSDDLRMVGFNGCIRADLMPINPIFLAPGITYDAKNMVAGRAYTSPDPAVGTAGLAGSDVITIKRLTNMPGTLSVDMATTADPLVISNASSLNFTVGQLVAIANCTAMDIFRATAVTPAASTVTLEHAASGNTSPNLETKFVAGARVFGVTENTYYVKNTGRTNAAGQIIWGFYRRPTADGALLDPSGNDEEELAEGVEGLRISYGIDTSGDDSVDSYATADSTGTLSSGQWEQVRSVRIELLVASVESNTLEAAQPYTFNGTTTTPADRRLRTSVGTTVLLRSLVFQ